MDKQTVIDAYYRLGSLRSTAQYLHISYQTVRRVLIESGDYVSPTSDAVAELATQGWTVPEIAEKLGMSSSTVWAYMPYTKGWYHGDKSINAQRIQKTRAKQKKTP